MAYSDVQDRPVAAPSVGEPSPALPAPAVPLADGLWGLAGLCVAWALAVVLRPPPLLAAWRVMFAVAIPMLVRELRRAPPSMPAVAGSPLAWCVGFIAASAPFILVPAQSGGVVNWI